VIITVAVGQPARAISMELAKKCRDLAIKAHPYELPGEVVPFSGTEWRLS